MFSPEAQAATSARNPRRRARQTSEELTARPNTKRRKRSALAPDTFDAAPTLNGHAKLPNGNGVAKDSSPEVRSLRSVSVETAGQQLTHRSRGSKIGERKAGKRDAGLLQAETEHYSIWKESELPTTLKEAIGQGSYVNGHAESRSEVDEEPWRADLSTKLRCAVAFTRKHAVVWSYGQGTNGLDASKVLSVQLPFTTSSSRFSKDQLPLGALVHDTGAGELGLLAVMPSNGKMVYWESVASAANADVLRQKQHGAHGAVSGLFSGESIAEVTEAEPDSFILATSYGRTVHISVRDLQGRPHISSTILRGNEDGSRGLFGSLKNVFSVAGWRKDIAGVRAGPMRGKSGRQCIVGTASGRIQTWLFERHASKTLISEVEASSAIHAAIALVHPDREQQSHEFRLLDFTYHPKQDEAQLENPHLLLLCGYASGSEMFYYLVNAKLQGSEWDVQVVRPISCWSTPPDVSSGNPEKLRVLLPDPGHTAFVIGSHHIILVSMAEVEESPDTQLKIESHALSDPFQDVLRLNSKQNHHVLACGTDLADRSAEKASCMIIVDNYGFARASASPVSESDSSWDRRAYLCTSHIEQGVFFGNMNDNLLDFSSTLDKGNWTDEEIEKSAIQVNDSIVENKSKRILPMSPSMEQQLQTRALWLKQLINYVRFTRLSHRGRWHMLWAAEKMAAAEALWASYSELLRTKGPREKLLLAELIDMMSEKYKHKNNPEMGETDIVRHYFIHDIANIELLMPWAQKAVDTLEEEGAVRSPDQEGQFMRQASEIISVGFSTAFEFRMNNCQSYGIQQDLIDNGIYKGDYSDLPQFWTSPPESPISVRKHTENVCNLVVKHNAILSPREGEVFMNDNLLALNAADAPVLIETCCRVWEERCRWLAVQSKPESRRRAQLMREEFLNIRKDLLLRAQELELEEDAFRLAEYYKDMDALAELLARSYHNLSESGSDSEDQDYAQHRLDQLDRRMAHFFDTYGEVWAKAMYDRRVEAGQLSDLLSKDSTYREYLTKYLRDRPQLRKLSWINDALLNDFGKAAESLMSCSKKDDLLWARKIDLSLAKLGALAAHETHEKKKKATKSKPTDPNKAQEISARFAATTGKIDKRLEFISAQERLYAYTRPILSGAIDVIAEVDLAMDSFGAFVKGKQYLAGILRSGFEKLGQGRALDADELVDMLTLLSPPADQQIDAESEEFAQGRYFFALQLLSTQGYHGARRELAEKIVWRRALLQNDWKKLNRTETSTDEMSVRASEKTALFRTVKLGYLDGLLNDFPPVRPSALQGAGTTVAALRASEAYSKASDDVLKALAADLETEDKALAAAVKDGRLEQWWPGIVNSAQVAVRKEMDEEGERMKASMELRRKAAEDLGESQEMDGGPAPTEKDVVMVSN